MDYGLPASVAITEDSYKAPGSGKTLILIQDAHTNPSGQLNLAKTLDMICRKEPLRYVFLEAGAGNESISFLRKYAAAETRKRVGASYLRQGKLQGSEYADLTTDHRFILWGVEDANLYGRSVETYRFVSREREKFSDYLDRLEAAAETLKSNVYNPFLFSFDKDYRKFQKGEIALSDYFEILVRSAGRLGLGLENYTHLKTLRRLKEMETKIDFQKASLEQAEAVDSLSAADRSELSQASSEKNRSGKIGAAGRQTQNALFACLEEKLGGRISNYPELSKYFEYLKEAEKIDARAVLSEKNLLEEKIFRALTVNQDEETMIRVSRNVESLKRLLKLSLTPDEFESYKKEKKDFDIRRMTGFLNKKIMDLKNYYEKTVYLENGYENVIEKCEEFYSLTYERDKKFIENLVPVMEKENLEKAVLVTGGYHSPNLKHLLRERKISYLCLTPQILQETDQKKYEELLLKQDLKSIGSIVGPRAHTVMLGRIGGWDPLHEWSRFEASLVDASRIGEAEAEKMSRDKEKIVYSAQLPSPGGLEMAGSRGARLASPGTRSVEGYSIAKLKTLIDHLRTYRLSPEAYEAFGDNNFESMRMTVNEKSGSTVFGSLSSIGASRIDTLAQYQAESGNAIDEIVKNAADWSVGSDSRTHHRSSKHGEGAFQILGELDPGADHVVIETQRAGRRGVRVTLWNEGQDDYRVHYELVDGLEAGTTITVVKKLTDKQQSDRTDLLRRKLRVHTAGPIFVNGTKVNTPENYEYAGPAGGGQVDEATSRVDVTVSANGWVVKDRGLGMDLKGIVEDFLSPHFSENGDTSRSKSWSANQIKRFSNSEISNTTRVEMWINGHQITSYSNGDRGDERLNLAKELIIDFPYGVHSPSSWNRVEMDGRVIDGMKKVIINMTDPETESLNQFAQINSMAILLQSLNENPKAMEILISFLKQRVQALIAAKRARGAKIITVPNRADVPLKASGWAMYDDPVFTPLDPVLLDFNLEAMQREGLLTAADPAFLATAMHEAPRIHRVYAAHWNLKEKAGSAVVWIMDGDEPVLLVDQAAYEKHRQESQVWFQALCFELGKQIEEKLGPLTAPAPVPVIITPRKKNRLAEFLRSNKKALIICAAGSLIGMAVLYGASQLLFRPAQPQAVQVVPGEVENPQPEQEPERVAPVPADWKVVMENDMSVWEKTHKSLVDSLRFKESKDAEGKTVKVWIRLSIEEIRSAALEAAAAKAQRDKVYKFLHDQFERQKNNRNRGGQAKEDWEKLKEFAARFNDADTIREDLKEIPVGNLERSNDLWNNMKAYGDSADPISTEMQREFGIINFGGGQWQQDLEDTQKKILQDLKSGDSSVSAAELVQRVTGHSTLPGDMDMVKLLKGKGDTVARYFALRHEMKRRLLRFSDIAMKFRNIREVGEKERKEFKELQDGMAGILDLKILDIHNPQTTNAIRLEIIKRQEVFDESEKKFVEELKKLTGSSILDDNLDPATAKIVRAVFTVLGWATGALVIYFFMIWLVRSQSPRKFGSASPFETAGLQAETSGPMTGRQSDKKQKSPDQVYGTVENPLPGFNRFAPLIVGYYPFLSEHGVWQKRDPDGGRKTGVGKRPKDGAEEIRQPTKITMWGPSSPDVEINLPNYPYGVITNIRVQMMKKNTPVPVGDLIVKRNVVAKVEDGETVRYTGVMSLPEAVAYLRSNPSGRIVGESKEDTIYCNYTGDVMISYEIHHYNPDDIEFFMPNSSISKEERTAVETHFGAEIRSYLKKAGGDPIKAIRQLLRDRAHYAADETKSLALMPGSSWTASFWEAVKDGKKAEVICNTAALLNAVFAAYFDINFCYVTQIIPDSQGWLGNKTVLTKSMDGHAAVLLETKQPTGEKSWRYEEAVANVGPRPLMVDLPRQTTVGVYVDKEKILKRTKAFFSFIGSIPGRIWRRSLWIAALVWECPPYFVNRMRVERVFRILKVDSPDAKKRYLDDVNKLYWHNANRFLKKPSERKSSPRLGYSYLGKKEFWKTLKKWAALGIRRLAQSNTRFFDNIFIISDGVHVYKEGDDRSFTTLSDGFEPQWTPMQTYRKGAEKRMSAEYLRTGENLLQQALSGDQFNEIASVLSFSYVFFNNAYLGADGGEEYAIRHFQLASFDLNAAVDLCIYLTENEFRVSKLPLLPKGDPNILAYFPGRQRIWAEWIASGGGMEFQELDAVTGLDMTGDLLTGDLMTKFPDGMSLGWVIDAARANEDKPQAARLAIPLLEQIRQSVLAAAEGKTAPLSQREMLGTISTQDRTRMVMIRELIQNSRDAIRKNLARIRERGVPAVIEVKSHLYERNKDIFWVLSVKDPAGMDRKTIFEKYFPPKATTKSVQQMIAEILEEKISDQEKSSKIVETLMDESHRGDAAMLDQIKQLASLSGNAKDASQEILKKYSTLFKKSLSAGFFGVGNYTVCADSSEIMIRSGLNGQVDEIWLRIDRNDPEDKEKVTGILLLSWKSYSDLSRQYEGTTVTRLKKVDSLADAYLEDRLVKYLFSEYIGAIDPLTDVEVVYRGQQGAKIQVHDDLQVLSSYGDVTVLESRMKIRRVTVDRLFIQAAPAPLLNEFIPDWVLAWEETRSVGVDYARGTPVVESRTALQKPVDYRNATTVARLKAAIYGYRQGTLSIPGLPSYKDFLRDARFGAGFPVADPDIVNHARDINEGRPLPDDIWKFYKDHPERYIALLLRLAAAGNGTAEKSLLEQKKDLFFGNVPDWLQDEYFSNASLRQILPDAPAPVSDPVTDPAAFSRQIAVRFFQAAAAAYFYGRLHVPGLPPTFRQFADAAFTAELLPQPVAADLELIASASAKEVVFAKYFGADGVENLAFLISSLPFEDGYSLRQAKQAIEEKARQDSRPPALPVNVTASDFSIVADFDRFVDGVIEVLVRGIPADTRMVLSPKEYLRLNLSRGGLDLFRAYDQYRTGRLDGRKFYEQLLQNIFTQFPSASRITVYDSLLKSDKTAAQFKGVPTGENPSLSLEQLEIFVRDSGSVVSYEKSLALLAPAGARLAVGSSVLQKNQAISVKPPAPAIEKTPLNKKAEAVSAKFQAPTPAKQEKATVRNKNALLYAAHVYDSTKREGEFAVENKPDSLADVLGLSFNSAGGVLTIRLNATNVVVRNYRMTIRRDRQAGKNQKNPAILSVSGLSLADLKTGLESQTQSVQAVSAGLITGTPKVLKLDISGFMNENTKNTDDLFVDWLIHAMHRAGKNGALLVIKGGTAEQSAGILSRAAVLYPAERLIYPNDDALPESHRNANSVTLMAVDPQKLPELDKKGLYLIAKQLDKNDLHNVSALIQTALTEAEIGLSGVKNPRNLERVREAYQALGVKIQAEDMPQFGNFIQGIGVTAEKVSQWAIVPFRINEILRAYSLAARMAAQAA